MSLLDKKRQPLISAGLFPDLPAESTPLFRYGHNVIFHAASVSPYPSQSPLVFSAAPNPIIGLHSLEKGGTSYIYYGDKSKLYRWSQSGGVETLGTGYGGTDNSPKTPWVIDNFGTWVIATNGVDAPQIEKAGSYAAMNGSGIPGTAKIVIVWSPFAFFLNTDSDNKEYVWSDDDNPETSSGELAGANIVRELTSGIKAARLFAGGIVGFSEQEMFGIRLRNDPRFLFGHNILQHGVGAVGPLAVVEMSNRLFGWGPAGIWQASISDYQYIHTPALHEYIYDDINEQALDQVVARYNAVNKLVEFYYPRAGATYPNRGVAFDPLGGRWTVLDFGRTAASCSCGLILATAEGQILKQEQFPVIGAGAQLTLDLSEEGTISLGYGEGGYGELGYGGEEVV